MIRPLAVQLSPLAHLLQDLERDRAKDISVATASIDGTLVVSSRDPDTLAWIRPDGSVRR